MGHSCTAVIYGVSYNWTDHQALFSKKTLGLSGYLTGGWGWGEIGTSNPAGMSGELRAINAIGTTTATNTILGAHARVTVFLNRR